jgi:hypothetical protein
MLKYILPLQHDVETISGAITPERTLYLSETNVDSLLAKQSLYEKGEHVSRTIIKNDTVQGSFPCTHRFAVKIISPDAPPVGLRSTNVIVVKDKHYYAGREKDKRFR